MASAYDPEIGKAVHDYMIYLGGILETFNFTRAGKERALGLEAAHLVAEGIVDRSFKVQVDHKLKAFKPNTDAYTADKVKKYFIPEIGFRTGQMISIPSLLGKVEVEEQQVTMRYGTGSIPTHSMTGNIFPSDMKATDTQKADWFTDKKGDFYGADPDIEEKLFEHFGKALDEFIDECNRRTN